MKIKQLPKEKYKTRFKSKSCQCATKEYGSRYFPSRVNKCSRFAAFEIDGVLLCKQHAGDACLAYMLSSNEE